MAGSSFWGRGCCGARGDSGAVGSSRAAGAQGATDGAASIDYGNIGAQGASGGGKHRLREYRSTRRLGRGVNINYGQNMKKCGILP